MVRFNFTDTFVRTKPRFDFGEPDITELRPSAEPRFADDIEPEFAPKGIDPIKNPITPGVLDILTGGLTPEEAERFKEATFEEIPTFEDVGKTVEFISNPSIIAKDLSTAIKKGNFDELSDQTKGTLKTVGFLMKTLSRLPMSLGSAIGAVIDKEDAQGVAREAVRGFLLPEDVDSIISRVPFAEFEREGETLVGSVARLIPRATVEAIELVTLYELTLGLPSKIRGVLRAPKERGVVRDIDKLYDTIKTKKPQIIEAVEAQGKFPKGATFAEKSDFFDAYLSVSKARAKLDPIIQEQLFKRQTFGKLFKESLVSEAAQARVPFAKGDIVRIGKDVGKIIEIQGTRVLLNIAGKQVTKELSEIAPEKPVTPVLEKPIPEPEVTPKVQLKPIPQGEQVLVEPFKTSGEAIAFGKQATIEQAAALETKQTDVNARFDALAEEVKGERTPEKVQELSDLATEGQFLREAIEASTKQEAIKAVKPEEIAKKLAEPLAPGKVKGPILEKTGVKKIEKAVATTERVELNRKLRLINKSIQEGIKEGKTVEKLRANQKEAIRLIKKIDKTRDQINAAIELEAVMPAPLESKSSAFNEHIAYFQGRQIPSGSKVRGLLSRIRTIVRLRRARKITASQANRISRRLRKELFNQADKEGVAIRMTPGGKIILAVRQSGVFVPTEFAKYPHFKNLSAVAGGGTDTTRMMEAIDGALSVAQKKGLTGQAGQAVQQVLWPTRDIMIQKMSYIEEKLTELKRIFSGIKNDSPDSILVTKVAEKINLDDLSKKPVEILQNPAVNELSKSEKIVTAAQELRVWFTDMIAEINAARELRNQDLIPVRDNYIPHEFLDQILWEQHGISTDKPSDVIEGQGNLPSYIKPNKPFNPREKAREFGIPYSKRLLDSVGLAENYIASAAKDIFNTSIIQNNKAFIQQLETMGFNKSAKTIGDWTAESFAGIRPVLDNAVNLPEGWTKGLNFFNRLRNTAVFPFNFAWNLLTQTSSITLTLTRYGGINTLRGLASWMVNPRLRKQTSEDYFSFIIKAHKQGRLSRQDVQNLIGQDVKIYRKPSEVIEDVGTLFGDSIERLLTGASIEAARLKGIEKGLTGEALKQFSSDGGGKTQSMYNAEDKPGVLRAITIKTVSPYQTFMFEVANTFREWLGKTGTPPDDAIERMMWVIRFMAGVTVTSAIAAKNGKKLWDWLRAPIPFAEYWLNPIINKLFGEYTDGMGTLPSPVQAVTRMAKGLNDYLETGSTRKLRNETLKWAPGLVKVPGGIAISRAVDGWIGYAEGGIYDRRGRKMFGIETEGDLIRGMFSGVWSTKGGQEYLKKRESKLDFNVDSLLDDLLGIETGERRKRIKRSKRQVRERRKRTRRFNF